MHIYKNETIDDLGISNLKIIQKKKGFKFGIDAVLLADFVKVPPNTKLIDLCSGSGIIALLLYAHYSPIKVDAVEIQETYAEMAKRSVELNNLENIITVYNDDLKNTKNYLEGGSYTAVVCNPPYKKANSGLRSECDEIAIAREEICTTLNDIALCAKYLLKEGGKLCLVHRPERLSEIIITLKANNLSVKRLRFVHKNYESPPTLVLIEAQKNRQEGLIVEKPLILYDNNGYESCELRRIYRRKD